MNSVLTEKWLWIIIITILLILLTPLLIIWFILMLPTPFNMVAVICLLLAWGVAAGYKEWVLSKTREKE